MEFHVLAESGEDKIAFSSHSEYAANVEMAEALAPASEEADLLDTEELATPGVKTIEDVCKALNVTANRTIKTLIVKGSESKLVALVLRGDHQLNAIKAEKIEAVVQANKVNAAQKTPVAWSLNIGPIDTFQGVP